MTNILLQKERNFLSNGQHLKLFIIHDLAANQMYGRMVCLNAFHIGSSNKIIS